MPYPAYRITYGKPGGVQRQQALTLCAIRQFIASELQENV
ncbi:hypothetical protein A671_01389 [Salmonella enterica subsp. enterica serovar Dublin str. DG22]|uniref:Uncharacterized protein n=3 Tax=Salmonella dublin TaxID=98360 RepID=M7RZD3_SALDU|nr:hypothetical protein SeD_A4600 [Salmonella enterica subsp. enterica serovar Dublin str. CT_02021853]EGE32242.1 hypothetical protein SD3246_4457 [Salmonella enterica subsp. enterica serovar Dublin str. SD3246]EMR51191.1 hypothetical protein A670_03609 [Salmonella enterica subsp. enterica serovar Dublin str. UC16]EPI72914.1 hypothetical protein A671_01389 [Salmonella enterica subsp. enterica serovar Dublin str. DG22]